MLMRANIQAVSLKIQTLKSQNAMAQAMKGVTKAMMNMNKQMKLPEIQKIMQEFEKQSEIMDMKEEMMSDVIDDALGDEDDEEESDAIVSQVTEIVIWVIFTLQQNFHFQVLDELGLQMGDQISGLPGVSGTVGASTAKNKAPVAAAEVSILSPSLSIIIILSSSWPAEVLPYHHHLINLIIILIIIRVPEVSWMQMQTSRRD